MFWEMKKSNAAIKKEVIACKVALNALVNKDKEDEKILDIFQPNKNKDIPLMITLVPLLPLTYILMMMILDLYVERQTYEKARISSSYN